MVPQLEHTDPMVVTGVVDAGGSGGGGDIFMCIVKKNEQKTVNSCYLVTQLHVIGL